jgi:hypothetical protein
MGRAASRLFDPIEGGRLVDAADPASPEDFDVSTTQRQFTLQYRTTSGKDDVGGDIQEPARS